MRPGRRASGSSLLELIVAVALFAVVAALAWGGLDQLLRARRVIDTETAALAALQRSFGQLERDLRQAVPRPVRDGGGQPLAALAGARGGVELTRLVGSGGWYSDSPALERIAWRCEDGRLQRLRWGVLDRLPSTPVEVEDMLEGVERCSWSYLGAEGAAERWPSSGGGDLGVLPRAVEWRFELEGRGGYRRLFELPAGGGPPP